MFSCKYDINNFGDIPKKFIDFLSYEIGNDDVVILRSKYDDWQGATFSVPIGSYPVHEDVTDRICIIADYTAFNIGFSNGVGTSITTRKFKNTDYFYNVPTLIDYLSYIYPNADIIFRDCVDYINTNNWASFDEFILYTISDVVSNYGNIDKLVLSFSDFYQDVSSLTVANILNNINSSCYDLGIDIYIVYTPTTSFSDEFNCSIESYVYQPSPRKVFNFFWQIVDFFGDYSLASRLLSDISYISNNNSYVDISDINKAYCRFSRTSVRGSNPLYNYALVSLYTRYVLSSIFNVDREEYYVSLMYSDNPKIKYSQLFTTYDEYMVEEFNYEQYRHGGWSIQSKYGSNPPNIFKNTGQLVSVGVHTSYDPFLWMCEQGGITCKKEEDEQIEDLDLMGFYAFLNGSPNKAVKPPVFPTTGCPWFTISNKNISDYGIANCPAKLYITRVGSSFILTVRVIDANGQKPDLWQSITFGEFVGRLDGYNIDQFYCAGGNQALSPDSWTYFSTSHIIGLQMDLDMKNSSIVNSNILHPSKFEKTNLSNFRIMDGEGTWEDIYSATQGYKEYQYLDSAGNATIYTWGVPLTKPNFNLSDSLNTVYPYLDWQHKIDSYTINNYGLKKNNMSGKVDPLTVYLASSGL